MHPFPKLDRENAFSTRCILSSGSASPPAALSSQARIVNATIDTSKTGAPISKYIYGQFLEHGGDIVNTGVWSEMLVDRKFFYPVAASAPTPPPVMGNAAGIRASAALLRAGGRRSAATTSSPWTRKLPTPANSRRWSNSTRKSRMASANPESLFAKAKPTRAASCSPALRARSSRSRSSGARSSPIGRPSPSARSARDTANSLCASPPQPIPTTPLSKSPVQAPARFMSGPSR